jgi:GR25 family glycosyltransferase involved in LPS biosynthesis
MLEKLIQSFLENGEEHEAVNIIRVCRGSSWFHLGKTLSKYFLKFFPTSAALLEEYAICNFYAGKSEKAFDIFSRLLRMNNLTEEESFRALFNAHFSINNVADRYIHYNPQIVKKITHRKKNNFPFVTFSVTTCKRFDLFEKSINSFLNSCIDLERIDHWLCVDDNSSVEDREKMKELYPFFNFYLKTPQEKGHPQSMNIIQREVQTPYLFHMEDDWKFFIKRPYITECLEVLGNDTSLGQCLINRNYAETERDIAIKGGIFQQTKKGTRYYKHEYCPTVDLLDAFYAKYGKGILQCSYWPHFSFRPSLLKTKVFRDLGEFNEKVSHFERDYCHRYIEKGYTSAFFECIYSIHIGRLTTERDDKTKPNAYELNNEAQFEGKEERLDSKLPSESSPKDEDDKQSDVDTVDTPSISESDSELEEKEEEEMEKEWREDMQILSHEQYPLNFPKMEIFVVNLDRRQDRILSFTKSAREHLSFMGHFNRFSAVDGSKLVTNPQLQRIFDGNDYNMRRGMVGCAMSHIQIYIDLINSDTDMYMILEDDITFTPDFGKKLLFVYKQIKDFDWDMIYLGHHLRNEFIDQYCYDKINMPRIEKWDSFTALQRSLGGTGGYIITKTGAEKLLNYIDQHGMTNGIDTVQQKSADDLDIYYTIPHLIYSECYRGDNHPDTDIQYDYDSLTKNVEERLEEEKEFYKGIGREMIKIPTLEDAINAASTRWEIMTIKYFQGEVEEILKVVDACNPEWDMYYYTLNDRVIILISKPSEELYNKRYFNRLKKNKRFNVDDALIYIE